MIGGSIKAQRIIPPLDCACAALVIAFSNNVAFPYNYAPNAGLRCSAEITIQGAFPRKIEEAFFQINLPPSYRIIQGQCLENM